jgi:ATP-dependent RNA helicase DDX41
MENFTKWRPNAKYRRMTDTERTRKRDKHGVVAVGPDIPALIKSFTSMRLPLSFCRALRGLGIEKPSSLQMQGIPCVLLGRDSLLLSISREGKTLTFALPLLAVSLSEERRLPLQAGEGPLGLVIVPSRELAQQVYVWLRALVARLKDCGRVNLSLCTGGVDMNSQLQALAGGVHIVISTPGRLADLLAKGKINMRLCRTLVLDEADRLLDLGFDEEVRNVLAAADSKMQIILSAAVMPKHMQEFAKRFMQNPIYVASSRAELKKSKITQICDFVGNDRNMINLLETMIRTDPPVLVFCENKSESDEIEDFLKHKEITCASLHGGKAQTVRSRAISDFNKGLVSVLIATDIAARGLSFSNVRHIVNYDLPKDIDTYIQRLCRGHPKAIVSNLITAKTDASFLQSLVLLLENLGESVPKELSAYRLAKELCCEVCIGKGHGLDFCLLHQLDMLRSAYPLNL